MITQVSCKLTNSLLHHLDRQGVSLGPIFEIFDGPEEFLKDPHFWLEVSQVEKIFERASRMVEDPYLARHVAQQVPDLQTWGALDSVFKLMPSAKDYYANLGRAFSYFVGPLQDFVELERGETFVRFRFPIDRTQAPHIFEFLRALLETLPRYTGHIAAASDWTDLKNEMWISWDTAQPSLFNEEPGHVLNPKLLQNLTSLVENQEKQIEAKNREILSQRSELEKLKGVLHNKEANNGDRVSGLAQLAAGVAHEINNPLAFVTSHLRRFEEYFQKLSTYIAHLESMASDHDLKADLDIEFVLKETPVMIKEGQEGLNRVREIVKDLSTLAQPRDPGSDKALRSDLNSIIESSIKVLGKDLGDRIQVEKQLELSQPVDVYPVRMSQVFINLLSNAIHAVEPMGGVIKIKTGQQDGRAIIEIADSGTGMDEKVVSKLFTPFFTTKEAGKGTGLGLSIAQSIIEMHRGRIDVRSEKGKGSRFTISLPMKQEGEMHA
ncbi:MAG: HAMP domain-containing histidine kinase [Oligoflexia bacterium]|nr:HAMP domain-containing histidine kinase [Oligoflexia bacterium]